MSLPSKDAVDEVHTTPIQKGHPDTRRYLLALRQNDIQVNLQLRSSDLFLSKEKMVVGLSPTVKG